MILVIDDDPDTSFLVCTHLARAGLEAEAAATLAEGIALLPRARIVLSDRCLGEEDALTLFAQGRPANVKLALLVTGDDVPVAQAATAGFDDVVRKPVDAKRLIARLQTVPV